MCEVATATVWINQLQCSLQGYWSKADNACVLPLCTVTLLMNKNSFGEDEVKEAIKNAGTGATQAVFSNAFWVALDEYSQNTFSSFAITVPTPTFTDLIINPVTPTGFSIQLTPATAVAPNPVLEAPGDNTSIQRMRWSYDVVRALARKIQVGGPVYFDGKWDKGRQDRMNQSKWALH